MVHQVRRLVYTLGAAMLLWAQAACAASDVTLDHVRLSALVEKPARPGAVTWIAIRQIIALGWHTYWKNPGDSGLATSVSWRLPQGISPGSLNWPVPEAFTAGPIVNYGYRGTAIMLVPLRVAPGTRPGIVKAKVALLECEQMCIPEEAILDLDLRRGSANPEVFATARSAIPRPFPGTASIAVNRDDVTLVLKSPMLAAIDPATVRFYPATPYAMDYDSRPSLRRAGDSLVVTARRSPFEKKFQTFTGTLAIAGASFDVAAGTIPAISNPPSPPPTMGLLLAAAAALLGGLILNLMPCVLPILSMKVLALAGHERQAVRRAAAGYFLGVISSFLSLAGILLSFKAFGVALGWGFQLQYPLLIFALMLLMLTMGLNLLGVFEIPSGLMAIGGRRGPQGSFWTGVLAAIVATPCTAPFMATALGYALTAPAPAALAVFLALGTGFALPFSAVAFVPALAKMIPRPGPWMMGLREFLAFPLLGTAVWLSWVLNRQVGPTAMMLALFCLLGVVFAGWLWRQSRSWSRALAAILAAGAMIFAGLVFRGPAAGSAKEIHWAAWSPEAVQAAQRSGRPIFVDFSAAWCVTCLVNEHVALSDRAIVEGFARDRVVALKADWTNRDDAISAELRSHARDGVPLYLFYPGSEEAPPTVLPQILTPAAVLSALKLAEKPGASI